MKTPLDYFKEQEPEDWADCDYYKVDSMLNLMDRIQKDAYNKALKDAAENINENTKIYADLGVAESIRIEIRKLKK